MLLCDGRYICSPELYAPILDISASSFFSFLCWLVVYLRLQNKFMSYFRLLFFVVFRIFLSNQQKYMKWSLQRIFTSNLNWCSCCSEFERYSFHWLVRLNISIFLSSKQRKKEKKNKFYYNKKKSWSKKWLDGYNNVWGGSNDDVDAPK